MSEKRIFGEDTIKIDYRNFVEDTDPVFGAITVFKDVVIASEIIHEYGDGNAYKPADELEQSYWTWDNRWAVSGDHPATGIVSRRGDVHGRTVNLRFVKNLKDPKTDRPNRRGVLADLQVFNKKVSPEILQDMKEGILTDVSIGFFFTMDAVPGIIEEDGHPLNGQEYDYVQRNFMGDHTAFGIVKGRCTMPYCGIGADKMMEQVTGDPLGKYKDFADCVSKNQDKDDPEAYCGSIEHKIKEAKKKKDSISEDARQNLKALATAIMKECDDVASKSAPVVYNILPAEFEDAIMKSVSKQLDSKIKGLLEDL